MTIIRLHLTHQPTAIAPIEEMLGQGRLIRVRLPVVPKHPASVPADENTLRARVKQVVRDWILYNPLVWRAVGARRTAVLPLMLQPGQAMGAGPATAELLQTRNIGLVMLHFFGGADADAVMAEARKSHVPFAVLNHYSNDRFLHRAIRKHTMLANGVAGVNGLGLPRYVRRGFANLSDGIDTEFFRREKARPLADAPASPVILLPARVVREKGQLDLVRAVASLRASGLKCGIAFAGRVDSSGFVDELRQEISRAGMTDDVRFLGDLTVEGLRDWYAACTFVAFPTHHHEGLGRVIVEAQAMHKPVVAYATGGVPEGIDEGRTGFLVPTGDIAGLARRMRELLDSPTLLAEMGQHGRAAAENRFSLAALADRHEQFYLRVIADHKKSARGTVPN